MRTTDRSRFGYTDGPLLIDGAEQRATLAGCCEEIVACETQQLREGGVDSGEVLEVLGAVRALKAPLDMGATVVGVPKTIAPRLLDEGRYVAQDLAGEGSRESLRRLAAIAPMLVRLESIR